MSDSNTTLTLEYSRQSLYELSAGARDASHDRLVLADVVKQIEKQKIEDAELANQYLDACARGNWNRVQALNPEIANLLSRKRETYSPC